jgi:hypothetical protein
VRVQVEDGSVEEYSVSGRPKELGMDSNDRMRRGRDRDCKAITHQVGRKGVTGIEVARLRKTMEDQVQAAMIQRSREELGFDGRSFVVPRRDGLNCVQEKKVLLDLAAT